MGPMAGMNNPKIKKCEFGYIHIIETQSQSHWSLPLWRLENLRKTNKN